jgi:hypothetical protein
VGLRRHSKRLTLVGALALGVYFLLAYLVLPVIWRRATEHRPSLAGANITHTMNGIPGDPLNIALVGSKSEVILALTKAGWFPADPTTFDTAVRIAVDSVFRRPDDQAPVSNLFLFGRKQDLAFEKPVGDSPRQRHHVRFWLGEQQKDDRPIWIGAATFDERVGLSHTTGQVTHHIGPDVDAERDGISADLKAAGSVDEVEWVDDFHKEREGKNGGGDPWRTDGRLGVVILEPGSR